MTSKIDVKAVSDANGLNDFVHLPDSIYADSPQYVPEFESDIRDLFDPMKNSGLEFSDIQPFVAYRKGVPVGRIAGIVNRRANERWHVRCARFSLIEFIDDPAVSSALFEAVAQWGRERGMSTLQGPMGITDFDKEGMLVEDFHLSGTVNTIYNHPYYPRHLEALGFVKEVDWVQIRIEVPREVPARYARVARYVHEQMGMRVIKLSDPEAMEAGDPIQRIFALLNEAYAPIFGYSELSPRQVDEFANKYFNLIDKRLVPIVIDTKGDFVGVSITMHSLTQAMQKSKGRLWPFGWYHLLKALKWHRPDNAEMLINAVRPDYQGMGLNALFFDDLIPIYNEYGIRWAETGPQLESNIRELAQWKPLHPQLVKRRRCYGISL